MGVFVNRSEREREREREREKGELSPGYMATYLSTPQQCSNIHSEQQSWHRHTHTHTHSLTHTPTGLIRGEET